MGPRPPSVELRRARSYWQRTLGWVDVRARHIVVYWHPLWTRASAEETLLHEQVHLSGRPGAVGHGPRFKRALARAARLLGVEVESTYRSTQALDRAIVHRRWVSDPWSLAPCWSAERTQRALSLLTERTSERPSGTLQP